MKKKLLGLGTAFLIIAASAGPLLAAEQALPTESEWNRLSTKVTEQQQADYELWLKHAARLTTVDKKFDKEGRVMKSTTTIYRRTPGEDGPSLRLLAIDGQAPSARAIKKEQRKAAKLKKRMQKVERKHGRSAAEDMQLGTYDPEQMWLKDVFGRLRITSVSREKIGDLSALRLGFESRSYSDPYGYITYQLDADVWVDEHTYHVIRAMITRTEVSPQRVVNVTRSINLEYKAVDDAWLPHQARAITAGRVRFKSVPLDGTRTYDDYKRVK